MTTNFGITVGVINPDPNGGGGVVPSLPDVLKVGDRTIEIISLDTPTLNEFSQYSLAIGDELKILVLKDSEINFILEYDTFKDYAQIEIYNSTSNPSTIIAEENIDIKYNNVHYSTLEDVNSVQFPTARKAVLKKQETSGGIEYWFLTFESAEQSSSLADVLLVSDRKMFQDFPLEPGAFDLLPEHRNQMICFTDDTIDEDKIIFVSDFLSYPASEYKIYNSSSYILEIKPKDGVTLLGDNLFIPKNSTAIIRSLRLLDLDIQSAVFSVTYEKSQSQNIRIIIKDQLGINAPSFEILRNETPAKFHTEYVDEGSYFLISDRSIFNIHTTSLMICNGRYKAGINKVVYPSVKIYDSYKLIINTEDEDDILRNSYLWIEL